MVACDKKDYPVECMVLFQLCSNKKVHGTAQSADHICTCVTGKQSIL